MSSNITNLAADIDDLTEFGFAKRAAGYVGGNIKRNPIGAAAVGVGGGYLAYSSHKNSQKKKKLIASIRARQASQNNLSANIHTTDFRGVRGQMVDGFRAMGRQGGVRDKLKAGFRAMGPQATSPHRIKKSTQGKLHARQMQEYGYVGDTTDFTTDLSFRRLTQAATIAAPGAYIINKGIRNSRLKKKLAQQGTNFSTTDFNEARAAQIAMRLPTKAFVSTAESLRKKKRRRRQYYYDDPTQTTDFMGRLFRKQAAPTLKNKVGSAWKASNDWAKRNPVALVGAGLATGIAANEVQDRKHKIAKEHRKPSFFSDVEMLDNAIEMGFEQGLTNLARAAESKESIKSRSINADYEDLPEKIDRVVRRNPKTPKPKMRIGRKGKIAIGAGGALGLAGAGYAGHRYAKRKDLSAELDTIDFIRIRGRHKLKKPVLDVHGQRIGKYPVQDSVDNAVGVVKRYGDLMTGKTYRGKKKHSSTLKKHDPFKDWSEKKLKKYDRSDIRDESRKYAGMSAGMKAQVNKAWKSADPKVQKYGPLTPDQYRGARKVADGDTKEEGKKVIKAYAGTAVAGAGAIGIGAAVKGKDKKRKPRRRNDRY